MMYDALRSLLLALLTGTLLLGSCGLAGEGKKEEIVPTDSTYFKARLNGEEVWSGGARAGFSEIAGFNWLQIFGDTTHQQHYPYSESLGFSIAYRGPGEYTLVEVVRDQERPLTSGASYYEADGDVLISSYHATDDTSANQLTITSYDSTAGIMTGTFRTTVVVDSAQRVSEPGEPPARHAPLHRRRVPGGGRGPAVATGGRGKQSTIDTRKSQLPIAAQ